MNLSENKIIKQKLFSKKKVEFKWQTALVFNLTMQLGHSIESNKFAD
jgi:hypothetical protein